MDNLRNKRKQIISFMHVPRHAETINSPMVNMLWNALKIKLIL